MCIYIYTHIYPTLWSRLVFAPTFATLGASVGDEVLFAGCCACCQRGTQGGGLGWPLAASQLIGRFFSHHPDFGGPSGIFPPGAPYIEVEFIN
jgi:hypothetical protein